VDDAEDGAPLCPHGHRIRVAGHDPFAIILARFRR
jgi:hypothetical protein